MFNSLLVVSRAEIAPVGMSAPFGDMTSWCPRFALHTVYALVNCLSYTILGQRTRTLLHHIDDALDPILFDVVLKLVGKGIPVSGRTFNNLLQVLTSS